jgi:hypothetical protein
VRRSLLPFPLALVLALAVAAVAYAGGFATAGLSSTPDGVAPGKPWKVDITVLQHGRTPLEGLVPRVRISSRGETREFAARPAGEPGVYRAEVVFPRAGRWSYAVRDGFVDQVHTFAPVAIGTRGSTAAAPAPTGPLTTPAPTDSGGPEWGLLGAAALALAAAAAILLVDRRRRGPSARGQAPEPA